MCWIREKDLDFKELKVFFFSHFFSAVWNETRSLFSLSLCLQPKNKLLKQTVKGVACELLQLIDSTVSLSLSYTG